MWRPGLECSRRRSTKARKIATLVVTITNVMAVMGIGEYSQLHTAATALCAKMRAAQLDKVRYPNGGTATLLAMKMLAIY